MLAEGDLVVVHGNGRGSWELAGLGALDYGGVVGVVAVVEIIALEVEFEDVGGGGGAEGRFSELRRAKRREKRVALRLSLTG